MPVTMERSRARHNERGFSLLDVLVALTLLSVAAGGIFAGFKAGLSGWTVAQQFAAEQQNSRLVLDWTTGRLRMAGYGYAAGPAVEVAEAGNLVFYGDTDDNGRAECHRIYRGGDGIVYVARTEAFSPGGAVPACASLTGTPLTSSTEATRFTTLSLAFSYFDSGSDAGQPAGRLLSVPVWGVDRARIRRVTIRVEVEGLQLGDPFAMENTVAVR